MSRCDYDTIFQRVFCVTLVAIAVTFTVILTNVFVDIDGILAGKNRGKVKIYDAPVPVLESEIRQIKDSNLIRPETFYKEERIYDEDNEENYRFKRSLDSPNFLFHVKNPKMKSILTNRLATLLEELDAEENIPGRRSAKEDNTPVDKPKTNEDELKKEINEPEIKGGEYRNDFAVKREEEDMLHLAMHNILLQGIIGHMDLNEVYRKVHSLVKSFKDIGDDVPRDNRVQTTEKIIKDSNNFNEFPYENFQKDINKVSRKSHNPSLEESKFFEELLKCDKLQNDITNRKQVKNTMDAKEIKFLTEREPKLLIKTIIDITSSKKDKARRKLQEDSKETIKGIIKLIYNGRAVKFSRMEDENKQRIKNMNEKLIKPSESPLKDNDERPISYTKNVDDRIDSFDDIKKQTRRSGNSNYLNQMLDDYFSNFPQNEKDDKYNNKMESKRLKRHIKIRYEDDETTTLSPKPKRNDPTDDDELFVEIETHFDSKGMKGDKKKKLIKSIIEKIQKAIHSDIEKFNDGKKRKHKHMQVKKRTQDPLKRDKKLLLNKIMLPFETIAQRHSDPISKVVPLQNPLPRVSDISGDNWKKTYFGPGFLAASKSINSAEMGDVDVDYNKIMNTNGIPQRLQKPLNTDNSEEMLNANSYFDIGNLKFFVKNIEGTGLSIGFNQYTDEPPDPDAIKLFTGIEHLVKNYHQNEGSDKLPVAQDQFKSSTSVERDHQLSKRDVTGQRNQHVVIRRSVKEMHKKDYHSNEYQLVFDSNYLPYNNYQEIYEDKKKSVALSFNKEIEDVNTYDRGSDNIETIRRNIQIKELPSLMDENNNIFYKKLKPSEILSLASLLDRKKRSMNMHKITNVKKKMKVNRYLNTRAMGRKNLILNKKRNKRQIDKIRIIATDGKSRDDGDNNFFIVGDQHLLADRAIFREVETPEVADVDERMGDQFDMPTVYEEPPYTANLFDGRSRQNQLMSKYPHIFLEEVTRSTEDYEPIVFNKFEIKTVQSPEFNKYDSTTEKPSTVADVNIPQLDDIVNAINPKQNYKLTLKILPKNASNASGFKEIHASINKSFNKDGLRYSSLVNVSEISKIENLHNITKPPIIHFTTPSTFIQHIKEQQNKMDLLLKQHKKRIDEQLDHLKRERLNLDEIDTTTTEETTTNKIEVTTSKPNPTQILQMTNEDVTKLLASLLQLQSQNELKTTTTSTTTTATTTTQPTTTPQPETTTTDNINSIILQQINKNTEMLQTFLQKLTDKLSNRAPLRHHSEEMRSPKFDYNSNPWKSFQSPPESLQQVDVKNETQMPVPFLYPYQPYLLNNYKNQQIPIASVMYQGHIHADALGKHLNSLRPLDPLLNPNLESKNRTKYFIDDMEDFKVLPVKKDKKKAAKVVMSTTTKT